MEDICQVLTVPGSTEKSYIGYRDFLRNAQAEIITGSGIGCVFVGKMNMRSYGRVESSILKQARNINVQKPATKRTAEVHP